MNWIVRSVLASIIVLAALIWFSRPDKSVKPKQLQTHLRVATANIRYVNDSPIEAAQLLASLDIDVLVVIEWTGQNLDESILTANGFIKAACKPRIGTHGICVFHQAGTQIQSSVEPTPVDGPCPMPYATIRLLRNSKAIGIQAIHAPPPISACQNTTEPTLNFHASVVENGHYSQALGVIHEGDKAVVLGDFNAFPFSKRVRQFKVIGMQDAFTSTRSSFGPTWSPLGFIPAIARIDYIWVSSEIETVDAWSMNIPGSDHRLVIADIF